MGSELVRAVDLPIHSKKDIICNTMDRFKYEKRSWYPHMKPADVALWNRFIEQNPNAYTEVAYDVTVGSGAEIPPGTQENIARDFTVLTQRKIDVVGFNLGVVDIIEVKPRAGTSAMGQVKGYAILYDKDHPEAPSTRAVLVTDEKTLDSEVLEKAFNVEVIVV